MIEKLPVFNLSQIFRKRDTLYRSLRPDFAGIEIRGADLGTLITRTHALVGREISTVTMAASLACYDGVVMTDELLKDLCWRFGANVNHLRAGKPVVPWRSPGVTEWVPVQVMRVDPYKPTKSKSPRLALRLRILAGFAAGLLIEKPFKLSVLPVIAREIGFTNKYGKYPYMTARHLVGLRFMAKLEHELASDESPSFFEVRGPAALTTYNRERLRVRLRKARCPKGFNWSCDQCAIGYFHCDYAVHARNYVQIQCPQCGQAGWSDPERDATRCIKCQSDNHYKELACQK